MKNKFANKFRKAVSNYKQGNYQQSITFCNLLLDNDCYDNDIYRLLIDSYISIGNLEAAAQQLNLLVNKNPRESSCRYQFAFVLARLGNITESFKQSKIIVQLDKKHLDSWLLLASCSGQLGYYKEAISASLQAIALAPQNVSANMNLATSYESTNQTDKAHPYYEKCALLQSGNPVIQCKLGDSYIVNNDKEKAEKCYRHAINIDPKYTHPYRQISRLTTYKDVNHEDFHAINEMLLNNTLQEQQMSNLHFALGKMYEDCGIYDKSFEHYIAANRIENVSSNFSVDDFANTIDKIQSLFDDDFLANNTILGSSSDVPVFIIGMPRSGTTLIEQIIASHPDCFGSGELYWFGQIESKLNELLGGNTGYPEIVSRMNDDVSNILANEYLSFLADITDNKNYKKIIDKLPGNFLHIGLISIIFPKAKFIHCKRNPLDTCLSIFSIFFPGSMPFSYDLKNIASVYNGYHKIMSHWEKVLPEKILSINYENIINNQIEESSRIIDFIDLDWNDECLNFYKNNNPVKTITAFQIRKELYTSSINRWKNFQENLQPLIDALDSDLMESYENN